jgi:hypothetical protein
MYIHISLLLCTSHFGNKKDYNEVKKAYNELLYNN